jgi:dTDP-3-amino-3,4,6-trideoxy-alpha-D-glucose transaminase
MKVPFLDLAAATAELRADIDAAVAGVLTSGWYLMGRQVGSFEEEFAAYCGTAHCVAVGSGCDALELTLRALGVGHGDEVIVPSHTFIATWVAVTRVGAVPVPVEPDPATYVVDAAAVEAAVTRHTRAVVPVHLYGQPYDVDAVAAVAARHGLAVLDDAAQAHGARYRGRRVGGGTNAAAFSFYPGKNLGALGDGGAVVTDDGSLADRIRLLRSYGAREKYRHEVVAANSRLDELQAAVLRVKLRHLDAWNARRAEVADRYLRELDGLPGIVLPVTAGWAGHVWHLFVVRVADRDAFQNRLARAGVATQSHYPVAVHRSEAYAGRDFGPLPVADELAAGVVSLPMGPHLPGWQVDIVVDAVRSALSG